MILMSRAQLKDVVDLAEAAYPGESCGLLVGRLRDNGDLEVTRVVPSANVAGDDAPAREGRPARRPACAKPELRSGEGRSAAAPPREGRRDRFEVDPELRLVIQRELEGTGERIVGVYHSHPDHSAQPSAFDLESVWEPEFVWVITAVEKGQAVHTTAHVVDPDGRQFRQVTLRTTDWQPYPVRGPLPGKEESAGEGKEEREKEREEAREKEGEAT